MNMFTHPSNASAIRECVMPEDELMRLDTAAEVSEAEEPSTPITEAEALLTELARLSPIEYDKRRDKEAKKLGIRVQTLDKEVVKRQAVKEDANGSEFSFDDPAPWEEPVGGDALVRVLTAAFTRYAVLPDHAALAMALWVLHTHVLDAANVSPLLCFSSPEMGCGKTTALTLAGSVVHRGLPSSNITAAALFRAIEEWSPTLLIDEADTFIQDNDELRGIINSGHTRKLAFVIRTVGDDHKPRRFTTWGAKAIALIGTMPPTLTDRAVVVKMRRKTATEHVERLRSDSMNLFTDLRRKCVRWAEDNLHALCYAEPLMPPELANRAADNWRILLAIADTAGCGEEARRAAIAMSVNVNGKETRGVMLLADIREIFHARGTEMVSSRDLLEQLHQMEERPWSECSHGKPMTSKQLARLLQPFEIASHVRRLGEHTERGYELSQFRDAFARYLSEPEITAN